MAHQLINANPTYGFPVPTGNGYSGYSSSLGAAPPSGPPPLPPKSPTPVTLDYELPKVVEASRVGWLNSAQAAAVVSVLFCGAETQLIASIKQIDPTQPGLRDSSPGAFRFLLLLSYSAFILNASATIASLIMIDRLGDLQFRAYQAAKKRKSAPIRHPSLPLSEKSKDDPDDWLLEDYGAGKRWAWMKLHCFVSLLGGSWCMAMQICLWIYLCEATSVVITMFFVAAFGVSPWFAWLVRD